MTAPGARARRLPWKTIGASLVVAVLLAAWRFLPLTEWLELLQRRVAPMGAWGGVAYGAVYVFAALLFVPGALLTVGAGLLFGLGWGTVIVSVASTATAAAAFLIGRHLARARVEGLARRNEKFKAIDRAIAESGWRVVLLLRLSPLVPFSVSNYLYGLTAVGFVPYLLASWAGMLPATVLYVFLGATGRRLGRGGDRSPWEWALFGAGLLATAAVTVILARVAKKKLAEERRKSRR